MARSYAVGVKQGTVTTTSNFCGVFLAATTIRPKVFEFEFGSSVAPADYASNVQLMRMTTAVPTGGNIAVAGLALDPGDPASIATGYSANTGGTTLSSILLQIGVNMRATFRWVAAPGKEIVLPATNPVGVGLCVSAQSTSYTPDATLLWEE
jgi:hypothetical protein